MKNISTIIGTIVILFSFAFIGCESSDSKMKLNPERVYITLNSERNVSITNGAAPFKAELEDTNLGTTEMVSDRLIKITPLKSGKTILRVTDSKNAQATAEIYIDTSEEVYVITKINNPLVFADQNAGEIREHARESFPLGTDHVYFFNYETKTSGKLNIRSNFDSQADLFTGKFSINGQVWHLEYESVKKKESDKVVKYSFDYTVVNKTEQNRKYKHFTNDLTKFYQDKFPDSNVQSVTFTHVVEDQE